MITTGKPLILFVAPLPPPVNGLSQISANMLDCLKARVRVKTFDTGAARGVGGYLHLLYIYVIVVVTATPSSVYMTLSGGRRQWFELLFLVVARLRGLPVYVHHHSFAYLDRQTFSARVFMRIACRQTHLVLCSRMASKLHDVYRITKLRVISNAALIDSNGSTTAKQHHGGRKLRIAFLSNITAEKGILEYFAALAAAQRAGLAVSGVIAGPVDPSVQAAFASAYAGSTDISYVGPVYGASKEALFRDVDILFFPTRYRNEAEPLTVIEALSHGVPVLAFERGCIAEILTEGAGWAIPFADETYINECVDLLTQLATDKAYLSTVSKQARLRFEALRSRYRESLTSLLAEISSENAYT